MKRILFLLLVIVVACSPKTAKRAAKADLENPRPEWMSAKPNQSSYFSGIGHGSKELGGNYIQIAKQNALEDLVSEIKVNVSASSVLTQIDRDKKFTEAYESIIQTSVADEIQEYELVGSWEDSKSYWVYYRLSKARYNQIKEEQKRRAVNTATDFYSRARQAEQSGNRVNALSFYLSAFSSLEKYLAEAIKITYEGREILLVNEIYASIQSILNNVDVSTSTNELYINRRLNSGQDIAVNASYTDLKRPASQLPLYAGFEKGAGDIFPSYKTDDRGQARILLTRIDSKEAQQTLVIKPDLITMAGKEPSPIFELITSRLTLPTARVLLKVKRPLVYVTSDEKAFGSPRSNQQVATRIKSALTDAGFELTPHKSEAELWFKISSDAERGSITGSIYVSFVSVIIKVEELKMNREIYATSLERIRGFSLDYERSSQDAYNKALDMLAQETMPSLIQAILQ